MTHPDARPRIGLAVRLAAALSIAVAAACAPAPPPVHPLGQDCTWPQNLDVQRDDLAVLFSQEGPGRDDGSFVLVHVPTGTRRAVCGDFRRPRGITEERYRGVYYTAGPGVTRRLLSPDYRYGVTTGGVTEITTGRTVPNPDPRWVAIGLPGNGQVLRQSVETSYAGDPRQEFCVAPRYDAPQNECAPLPDIDTDAVPYVDGTVGWAPARPVPVAFAAGGQTVQGFLRTDGVEIVDDRLEVTKNPLSYELYRAPTRVLVVGASGSNQVATLARTVVTPNTGDGEGLSFRFAWLGVDSVTSSGVTGSVYSPPADVETLKRILGTSITRIENRTVIENGRALLVQYVAGQKGLVYVRVDPDGGLTELARIPRLNPTDPDGEFADLSPNPIIYAWPDDTPPLPTP